MSDPKTLHEFCKAHLIPLQASGHARYIIAENIPIKQQWKLYHLDDYVVSGIYADVICLVRRRPFTPQETSIRGNVRNFCIGKSLKEVASMTMHYHSREMQFESDCASEYYNELRLEQGIDIDEVYLEL